MLIDRDENESQQMNAPDYSRDPSLNHTVGIEDNGSADEGLSLDELNEINSGLS